MSRVGHPVACRYACALARRSHNAHLTERRASFACAMPRYLAHGRSAPFALGNALMLRASALKDFGFADKDTVAVQKGNTLDLLAVEQFQEAIRRAPDHQ